MISSDHSPLGSQNFILMTGQGSKYYRNLRRLGLPKPILLLALIGFFIFFLNIFIPIDKAAAVQITLAWDENQEADLAGYKLYIGNAPRHYQTSINLGRITQYTQNFADGAVYYFTLTATNQQGYESAFSNEVRFPGLGFQVFLPMIRR